MSNKYLALLPALCILFLQACGGSTATTPSAVVQFAGNFAGKANGTDAGVTFANQDVAITIIQSGRSLSGTWSTAASAGSLAGEVQEGTNNYTFVLTQTSPCNGVFAGTGYAPYEPANANRVTELNGTYTGSYCGGTVAATFKLFRL